MARLQESIRKEWGLRFNGSTQYASTNATVNLSTTNSITITGWVKRNDANVVRVLMEMSSDYNSQTDSFALVLSTGGVLITSFRNPTPGYSDWTTRPLNIREWYFFAFSMDRTLPSSTAIVGYLNGVQNGTNTLATGVPSGNFGNRTVFMGARNGTSLFTSASLKDMRIYGSILSAAQIATMYSNGPNVAFGSPLSWYKYDEGTSTTLADSGSLANNATITGRTTTGATPSTMWVIDPVRPQRLAQTSNTTSIRFNGTSDLIAVPDNAALNVGTGDFTCEFKCIIKTPTLSTTVQMLFGKRESAGNFIGWEMYLNEASITGGTNSFTSNMRAIAANSVFAATRVPIFSGRWYHVIVSVTRATQENYRIFVNGVYDTAYTNTTQYSDASATLSNTASLTTGGRNGAVLAGTGCAEYDQRLYTRALTDDECLSRYYTNENITSGRVGYWPINEGAGTVITDNQGTNNGTLTGGTWTNNAQS